MRAWLQFYPAQAHSDEIGAAHKFGLHGISVLLSSRTKPVAKRLPAAADNFRRPTKIRGRYRRGRP